MLHVASPESLCVPIPRGVASLVDEQEDHTV